MFRLVVVGLLIFASISSDSSSSSSSSSSSDDNDQIDIRLADIDVLRTQIRTAIDESINLNLTEFEGPFIDFKPLLAGIVDLQWHDCAGPKESEDDGFGEDDWTHSVCDGCFDFNRFDFHGTLPARVVAPLEEIYQTKKGADNKKWKHKITRADFWAASSTLAIEYGAYLQAFPRRPIGEPIPIAILEKIPFYFGRKDCENSPESDESDFEFPPLDRGFQPSFDWFATNFQFTKAQFTALMGVHTLGKGRRDSSGFAHFWKFEDEILNNDYYVQTINAFAGWKQIAIDNTDEAGPDRIQWVLGNPLILNNPDGKPFFERVLRLNVDMSLYLKIEDNIDTNTGAVSCKFRGLFPEPNPCPFQDAEVLDLFRIYANETKNQVWMDDFRDVWIKMVTMGYDISTLKVIN